MSEWISVKNRPAPKTGKFLFSYFYGIGLGEWGQTYKTINGCSERDEYRYILILWPSEILTGDDPYQWDDDKMVEMEVMWMPLPQPPKEES